MKRMTSVVLLCGLMASGLSAAPAGPGAKALPAVAWNSLPLIFEANRGQADPAVKFLAHTGQQTLFLTPTEAVLVFAPGGTATALHCELLNANPDPAISGVAEQTSKVNYYRGADRTQWCTAVPTYAKVKYTDIYPGVDLVYYGNHHQLEYDYVLAPGADPYAIRLALTGAETVAIDAQGNLNLCVGDHAVQLHQPVIYQETSTGRQVVTGGYVLHGPQEVGFQIGAYDATQPLVIDPTVVYSTYLGGSAAEESESLALAASGGVYVCGTTYSVNFPQHAPLVQNGFRGGTSDVFVAKISPAGTLEFSTYLGGNGIESITSLVETNGGVYVVGDTSSTDFPTQNAYQSVYGGGTNDVFLVKLNTSGTLQFSTYLGGNGKEDVELDFDGSGNVYLSGQTSSSAGFPTHLGYQNSYGGGAHDLYVAKFNSAGAIQSCTLLGGSGDENGTVRVDSSGTVLLVGVTSSANFPLQNPVKPTYGGGSHDVFVTKLAAAGNSLMFSTYLGGNADEQNGGFHVDSSGL